MYLANSTFKRRGRKTISQQTVNSKMPSPHFPSGYNLSPVPQDNSRRVSSHQKVISFNLVSQFFTVCAADNRTLYSQQSYVFGFWILTAFGAKMTS